MGYGVALSLFHAKGVSPKSVPPNKKFPPTHPAEGGGFCYSLPKSNVYVVLTSLRDIKT